MLSPWSTVESLAADQPVLVPTKDNTSKSHADFVHEHIPESRTGFWYYNKYFLGSGDVLTVMATRDFEHEYPVWYGRRYFMWPEDGAQISVDYALQSGLPGHRPENWDEDVKYVPDPDTPRLPKRTRVLFPEEVHRLDDDAQSTRPLFVSVHGLTGGSHENYVRAAICEMQKLVPDIECAVVTTRGCNRSKITTPLLFNGAWTEDLRRFIAHVTRVQPNRPIFLAGYSLGGSILANYLGQEGDAIAPQIKAAVVVGNPWDLLLCHITISSTFLGRNVYQPQMAANLCRLVRNNEKVMEQSAEFRRQKHKLRNVKHVADFDDAMTAPLFGFESYTDYYRHGSSVNRLRSIRVPTLVLAAKDDPICGDAVVPYTELPRNPFTHLLTTTHGGHLGWFAQDGSRWYATVLSKYIAAFVDHSDPKERAVPPEGWEPRQRWFKDGRFQV